MLNSCSACSTPRAFASAACRRSGARLVVASYTHSSHSSTKPSTHSRVRLARSCTMPSRSRSRGGEAVAEATLDKGPDVSPRARAQRILARAAAAAGAQPMSRLSPGALGRLPRRAYRRIKERRSAREEARFDTRLRFDAGAPELLLSPHWDDAVLDCWALLSSPRELQVVN